MRSAQCFLLSLLVVAGPGIHISLPTLFVQPRLPRAHEAGPQQPSSPSSHWQIRKAPLPLATRPNPIWGWKSSWSRGPQVARWGAWGVAVAAAADVARDGLLLNTAVEQSGEGSGGAAGSSGWAGVRSGAAEETEQLTGRIGRRGGRGLRGSGRTGGGSVCSDTCSLARNGICEDGSNIGLGQTVGLQVACDFGTDCTDCGPYNGIVSTWGTDAGFQGPIDFLRRQDVPVWARKVAFPPYFTFAYTNPKEDLDVSEQLERVGCMELGIVQVFREVLEKRCKAANASAGATVRAAAEAANAAAAEGGNPAAPLVVDVGANFGFFTLYAAALGCSVLAVEPVPRFLAFLHWNLAANGLVAGQMASASGAGVRAQQGARAPAAVTVVGKVVSDLSGVNITVAAPRRGVWGTASVAVMNSNADQDLEHVIVPSVTLDELVGEQQVTLLKVDVEGYEPVVFRSGRRAIEERRVEHVVFEYSPGMPEMLDIVFPANERQKLPVQTEDPPNMLLALLGAGYRLAHLPTDFAKSGYLPLLLAPLPVFEEVTEKAVRQDLADVAWFRKYREPGTVCPWPKELVQANPVWGEGCFRAPDDSHPKGLRVMIAYNTNLWASLNHSAFNVSGPVGLFDPQQDERTSWWSTKNPSQGTGDKACPYLQPDKLLRSRCRCENGHEKACGVEQAVLLEALTAGRMPLPPPLASS